MSWIDRLDLTQAISNLVQEKKNDWYRDPWNWPEYAYLRSGEGSLVLRQRLESHGSVRAAARMDVPKENFGVRPAVLLDVLDRVVYQLLVDRLSVPLVGALPADVFGWRLIPKKPRAGRYARQDFQWAHYRRKISEGADLFDFGLKTDVTAFFASIEPMQVIERLPSAKVTQRATDKLARMLLGWDSLSGRPGIPQRSTASSVLANRFLQDVDAVLRDASTPMPMLFGAPGRRYSFARWMDDIWLFGDDAGSLRSTQVDLQQSMEPLGLVLNSGKTLLLEGDALVEAAKKLQGSVIDDALTDSPPDTSPLESLVDDMFDKKELTDRSTVRFISSRMRTFGLNYRIDDILEVAERLPHASDHLSRLFRATVASSVMQDWFIDYVDSSWNCFEWSLAQFATAISPRRKPRRAIRDLYQGFLMREQLTVPLAAVAATRLASWDPPAALAAIEDRIDDEESAALVRVMALAGLQAGAESRQLRIWLGQHEENRLTLATLERRSFTPPRLAVDYR